MVEEKLLTTNMRALKKIGLASIAGMAGTILYATFKDSFSNGLRDLISNLAYVSLIGGAGYAAGYVSGYMNARQRAESKLIEITRDDLQKHD